MVHDKRMATRSGAGKIKPDSRIPGPVPSHRCLTVLAAALVGCSVIGGPILTQGLVVVAPEPPHADSHGLPVQHEIIDEEDVLGKCVERPCARGPCHVRDVVEAAREVAHDPDPVYGTKNQRRESEFNVWERTLQLPQTVSLERLNPKLDITKRRKYANQHRAPSIVMLTTQHAPAVPTLVEVSEERWVKLMSKSWYRHRAPAARLCL